MFCKNCGKEILNGVAFCPECGAKLDVDNIPADEPIYEKKAKNNNKILMPVILIAVVACIVAVVSVSVYKAKHKYDTYEAVLQVCCEAINKRDKDLLDDVVYEDFGYAYNSEWVYDSVDYYYNYQEKYGKSYGELTTTIEDFEHCTTHSDLEDLSEELFDETGKIINIDEAYVIEVSDTTDKASVGFILIKTEGRWYVVMIDS